MMIWKMMFLWSMVSWAVQNTNPVKMSMILLAMSTVIFSWIYMDTSTLWFPIIMYMIFMGGILMIFMILSSVLPNERTKTNLKKWWWMLMFMPAWMLLNESENLATSTMSTKSVLSSSSTMIFLFLTVTAYFTVMILMISEMKEPLRSMKMC